MQEQISPKGWSDVDRSVAADEYIQYLNTIGGLSFSREYKRRTFELLQVAPGQRILDVGCGTGEDVRALAAFVRPAGRVTGVDASTAMISEARRRSGALGLPVDFQVGDAHALDFPEGAFEAFTAAGRKPYVWAVTPAAPSRARPDSETPSLRRHLRRSGRPR